MCISGRLIQLVLKYWNTKRRHPALKDMPTKYDKGFTSTVTYFTDNEIK